MSSLREHVPFAAVDVAIVGAGPAGTATALELRDSGLSVALLDKASFPRDKTCGDALSPDVLNQLEKISPELYEEIRQSAQGEPIDSVLVSSRKNRTFSLRLRNIEGRVMARLDFDHAMYRHAVRLENVTSYSDCRVQRVERLSDAIALETNRGILHAQFVIAADGASSVVQKFLAPEATDKEHHCVGLRAYYEGVQFEGKRTIELHFIPEVVPGYLWIFPMSHNRANVGIGMLSSELAKRHVNLKEVLQQTLAEHPQFAPRFQDAVPTDKVRAFGLPLGSKRRVLSGDRYLLTGDAGSLIDPLTGEGIGNAIRSGRYAAAHIRQAFAVNDFSAASNEAYDQVIYGLMGKEFRFSRALQKLARSPYWFSLLLRIAGSSQRLKDLFHFMLLESDLAWDWINPRKYLQFIRSKPR